ncbi:MAG: potassium channel protein [Thermodesulfobacteriota bacterium]|nr:potassium channel protein [Thermodesulfobacteriota bacterium]
MQFFSYSNQVVRGIVLTSLILLFGTIGYWLIEGWSLLDSLYMSIITLTTVGFSETHSLSPQGRIFTIFLLVVGVGFIMYMFTVLSEVIVSGRIESFLDKRKMEKQIADFRGHYILAGFGRIGTIIAKIMGSDFSLVILEKNQNRESDLEETGHPYILEDASHSQALKKAGVERAKALIAALPTDADNVYITLTAKELNPGIMIVARADHADAERRLKRAGADHVVSPYEIGARRMALILAKPTVIDFLSESVRTGNIDRLLELEEIKVEPASPFAGQTLIEANLSERCNIILLSIKKKNGEEIFNPRYMEEIGKGDTLLVLGESDSLKCLRDLAALKSLS